MKQVLRILLVFIALRVVGAPISSETAVERATVWMAGNPIMEGAGCSVDSVETFPATGTGYSVYVVRLSPAGYLVLNSDDHLPLVVCFSAESDANLLDVPENAFRAMLLSHIERVEEKLAEPDGLAPLSESPEPLAVTELYGPFLETSWNQCNPYNKLCPDDPAGNESYGYRAPSGCVPTAYAQLLRFHRWPLFGEGSRAYTDSSGSMTGPHSAEFSDAYDWGSMQTAYSDTGTNPLGAEDAVAELMYELGVAVEANYEHGGTGASTSVLGQRLSEYFFFESCDWHTTQSALISPMEVDLRAGFPCVVSIPGHAIVADGLMVDAGTTTYHFNYGWGGSNNGWWAVDSLPGGTLEDGATSLRPRLMAFPQTNAVAGDAGGSVELHWILPKRRETEVTQLAIHRLEQQTGTWQSDASEITAGINSGWEVVAAGHSGDGWYTGPNGPSAMVLDEIFVPDASASLSFWLSCRIGTTIFTVSASNDGGDSYTELFSKNNNYSLAWGQETVSLAAYAGQQVRLRFALSNGSYYPGTGGVWLDDLAMTSGDWLAWQPFAVDNTLASRRFEATETVWDNCADFLEFELTSTSTYMDWVVSTTSGVDDCFYKEPGGYGNREYHLTSLSTITPTASTQLLLHAKYRLASDGFRVLLSTDRSSFTEIWAGSGTVDWSDIAVDLSAYAGQAVYVRLEYTTGSYYSDGGVWVDSVGTQVVVNPELEGQPIHYTTLSNLPAGQHTLAAVLTDASSTEHGIAPSFILTVASDDADGDGMPTAWEVQYGLNPNVDDANLDLDNDGHSNIEEYICGTLPNNPDSYWVLESGAENLPAFYAMEARRYSIQYRTNLTAGVWALLVDSLSGSNGTVEVSDYDSSTNVARFYRVLVWEAE